jgi:hypothetical protein
MHMRNTGTSDVEPMQRLLAVAIALLLGSAAGAETVRAPQKLTPAQLVACKAKGGRPEMVLYYVESCVWPTSDAGRVCRDKSDCQGFCEAPIGTEVNARAVGQCSREASDRIGGCTNHVERGRSTGDTCVH